jgi:hypothetical protein
VIREAGRADVSAIRRQMESEPGFWQGTWNLRDPPMGRPRHARFEYPHRQLKVIMDKDWHGKGRRRRVVR